MIGMMWFDNRKLPLSEKIEEAVHYYVTKYGNNPNIVKINPSTEIDKNCNDDIRIIKTKIILPNYLWIGVEHEFIK